MEKLSMCRICLRENVKLKCIANTELQEVYQKLTCSTLKTEDCRPLNTCYLCSALLYKAYMLMVDCLAAEQWFTNVFKGINCLKHEVRCIKLSKTSVSSDELSFVKSKRNNKKHLQTKTTESHAENNYGNLLEISIECNKKINVDLEPCDDDTKKGKVEQIDEDEIVIPKQEQDCDVDIKDPFNEIIQVKIEEFTENIDSENKNLLKNGSIPDFEASENEDKVTNSDTPNSKKKRVNIKQKKRIIKKKRLIPKRPKIFACEQCPKVFKLKGNYERHKYVHNKNVICSCSICGKPFTVPQSYTKHMNWHTKPYKCDLCSAQYPELYQLKQHMALHEFGEVRYTCDYCQKTFKDKSGVRAHIMNNHAERPFACQLCDKSFATERKYDRHVSIIHAETEQYQCEKCAKTFRHYSSLYGHLKSHEDFKPHKCPLCKMGFTRQGGLRTHMLRQCGGLTQKCPLCDETFVRLKHLIQHKREAHSVGVFKCETCQMQLANPHSLKKHMRTHTGEKPYKCDVCDRSFSDGYTLKGHVRTHTGEKPYMCPLCPKAFAQKTPLTTHMRTHNSKKYK